jgi:hypothetical protein
MSNRIKNLGNRLEKIDSTNYKIENDGAGSARLVLILDLNNIIELTVEAGTLKHSPTTAIFSSEIRFNKIKNGRNHRIYNTGYYSQNTS